MSGDGKRLTIKLPPVEIFGVDLDNDKTRVYSRETWLKRPNPNLENEARQGGEAKILATACEDDVMRRATEDAQRAVAKVHRTARPLSRLDRGSSGAGPALPGDSAVKKGCPETYRAGGASPHRDQCPTGTDALIHAVVIPQIHLDMAENLLTDTRWRARAWGL